MIQEFILYIRKVNKKDIVFVGSKKFVYIPIFMKNWEEKNE